MADVRDMPNMPLRIERLRNSKAWRLCARQPELAYFLFNMWMTAFHDNVPAGSLADDEQELMEAAGADPKTWERLRPQLMRGWIRGEDARWYHPVVKEIADDVAKKRGKWVADKQRKRGGSDGGQGSLSTGRSGGQTGGHPRVSTARSHGHGAESTSNGSGQQAMSTDPPGGCPPKIAVSVSVSSPLKSPQPSTDRAADAAPPLASGLADGGALPVVPSLKRMPKDRLSDRNLDGQKRFAGAAGLSSTRPLAPSEVAKLHGKFPA